MKRLSVVGILLAVALMAAVLVGCGSSGSSSSSSTASEPVETAPASDTEAATGEPFVVGSICSCSGPFASNIGKVSETYKAWEEATNAAGGIEGHPVKVIAYDDGADPNKGLAMARKLVEQDHVMAIVGHVSVVSPAWQKYVDEKGIPVIGGNPDAASATDPNFFATGSPLPVTMAGQMQQMKKDNLKHFGILYCAEAPACAETEAIAKATAGLVGGIEVSAGKIAVSAPSYTAPCLQMKQDGVDALMIATDPEVVLRASEQCAQQGYEPAATDQATTFARQWLDAPTFEGATIISPDAPYDDTSLPAVKAFVDALEQYAPGMTESAQFSYVTFFPWIGGQLFKAAVEEGKLTPSSTPAEVTAAMYGLKDETLEGLTSPLTYTKGKPFIPACYWAAKIEAGELASLEGGEPTCLTPAELKGIGLG
jgi:branched-chain amino acid transport system substrate-binding protein